MNKMSIVILNYFNYIDTINCLKSIIENTMDLNRFYVIIVDNHSKNESYSMLREYEKKNRIIILRASKNLGFAAGNNIGIRYSREKLGIDKVLLLNNDTLVNQFGYLDRLNKINVYNSNIGAIGTKIINGNGENQNPVFDRIDYYAIVKRLFQLLKRYIILNLKSIGIFSKLIKIYKSSNNINKEEGTKRLYNNKKQMMMLHGSALLITPNYFKYFNQLYPKTFLYYEENILAILFSKVNLRFLYIDDLKIYHKEDQSSILVKKNLNKYKVKNLIRSVFLALMVKKCSFKHLQKIINI